MKSWMFIISLIVLSACNSLHRIQSVIHLSPSERYVKSLEQADLLKSPMAQAWMEAASRALKDTVKKMLPFAEAGYFTAEKPRANSYRFSVKAGQILTVSGGIKATKNAKVFVDLFILENSNWKNIAFADSGLRLSYEFDENRSCLLRVQPELLTNVYFAIDISLSAVLINPVKGASNRSIGSLYGAVRDGGSRTHEGVDIFASKGTPVLAPTQGYISQVGTNRLGGNVIWMRDDKRNQTYYFAHLDQQLVKAGTFVRQGDLLGLVGNTGNAQHTAPHLHFGIYKSGSRDPLDYIWTLERLVQKTVLDTSLQMVPYKIANSKAILLLDPKSKQSASKILDKGTYVEIIGSHETWYKILLPDLTEGYIAKKNILPAASGLKHKISKQTFLRSAYNADAVPIMILQLHTEVEILAIFGQAKYVKTEAGIMGWL